MEAEMDFLFRCVVKSLTVYRYDPLFFFNDTATTEIYTLSLHDALPIYHARGLDCPDRAGAPVGRFGPRRSPRGRGVRHLDRKSTRLNSSHSQISHAVFCFKNKTRTIRNLSSHP